MTEDEATKIMNEFIEKAMAEAIGLPTTPNKPTILRFVNGRFESRELDEAGEIIEPPARCPRCGPVLLCAEHMAMVS